MPLSQVNPEAYDHLLKVKTEKIAKLFKSFGNLKLEVVPSKPLNYRMRAEFRIWHTGDQCDYVMFAKDAPKIPVIVDDFPIGSETITQLMPKLIEIINTSNSLKERLFQIEFLTTQTKEALVTLIYHRKLDDQWAEYAKKLQHELNISIIGRSKKQKITLDKDFVTETIILGHDTYRYKQIEGGFTQPNAYINTKMLEWTLDKTKDIAGDLLELYCGNGNFTIVLSQNFVKVLATEISKTSVAAAHSNLKENNIINTKIARLSSEEFVEAFDNKREFRRLNEQSISMGDYAFSTVLVDPPRAGLDDTTTDLISRFDNIIYISCNPVTLCENLQQLSNTHKIEHFALFDQFPYTDHIESAVILTKY